VLTVAHAIGSFDDDAPCASRSARGDRIFQVVAGCNSEPWSRSAVNIFTAQNSTRILRFYFRVMHREVPSGNFIPNREYISFSVEVLFETDATEVADGHNANIEGELRVPAGHPRN